MHFGKDLKMSEKEARTLSYTILLEGVLGEKKCRQKHGGFSPEMTPLPWLLVPPAHEKTTDQAQFEPATVQTTPLVLAKIFIEFWSFCSKFELFWYFLTHLFDFWLFESRTQYTRPRKTAKHHENPEKFEKTRYFKSGYWQVKVSHVIDVLFLILKNTMGKNYTSRIWSLGNRPFVQWNVFKPRQALYKGICFVFSTHTCTNLWTWF